MNLHDQKKRLAEVATIVRGVSFDKSETRNSPNDSLLPILRAGNIQESLMLHDDLVWVPRDRVSAEQLLQVGDVLIAMSSGSPAVVGKTAQLLEPWTGSVGAFCAIIRFTGQVLPRYGAYWLRSEAFASWRTAQCQGANIQNLRKSDLGAIRLPMPKLADQERIVRLLDAAEELRRLRQQADRRTAELVPAIFHEMFGGSAAATFPVQRLAGISDIASGVAKGRRLNGSAVAVPYLRVANVQAGYLDLSELKTIEALPEEVEELALKKGDVLLTEGGDFDKLGRGAMWDSDVHPCIHQNHVFRVRVDESKILPLYFTVLLTSEPAKAYFLRCAKKTTNLASINMTQLRGLPVPIPPLSLQSMFIARVAGVRALQAQQAESRRRLDALYQSMLHRAFRGEL